MALALSISEMMTYSAAFLCTVFVCVPCNWCLRPHIFFIFLSPTSDISGDGTPARALSVCIHLKVGAVGFEPARLYYRIASSTRRTASLASLNHRRCWLCRPVRLPPFMIFRNTGERFRFPTLQSGCFAFVSARFRGCTGCAPMHLLLRPRASSELFRCQLTAGAFDGVKCYSR